VRPKHGVSSLNVGGIVIQQKTQRPVQFEITEPTREAVNTWVSEANLLPDSPLFASRVRALTAHVDAAIRKDHGILGTTVGIGQGKLRDAYASAYQGNFDL
jgi:hypothetical protein